MSDTSFGNVLGRVSRLVRDYVRPAVYAGSAPVSVEAWEVPDEPVAFAVAAKARFEPFAVGSSWGRPWGTTWFHVRGDVPSSWRERLDGDLARFFAELTVDLGFNGHRTGFQAEALAYDSSGVPLKAINPLNAYYRIPNASSPVDLYLEAASNPDFSVEDLVFQPSEYGLKETAGDAHLYELTAVGLSLFDHEVWSLWQDIETLSGLLDVAEVALPRKAKIARALDDMADTLDPDKVSETARAARQRLEEVLARPAVPSAHRVIASGHAHIDSAWLWPTRETVRKCARTFSNVLSLMDSDPEFVFACSSAQQFAWVKEYHPEIWRRLVPRVREGRFVPVGGMWVESDTNMPSSESMVRQFLFGKSFFLENFGLETEEVWLPDSFGYSAALPQIAAKSGSRWLLTQRLAWNTNPPPHSTFDWEGIDGSRLRVHVPPAGTYGAELNAAELADAERRFTESAVADTSLVTFGWSDGGGGPTREMLAYAHRKSDLEGSPQVTLGSPSAYFRISERELPNPAVWRGELYLEMFRGVFTSQMHTKQGNRTVERLLQAAELWATHAAIHALRPYPYDQLRRIWEKTLLQQFHDILPGTSIAWVHVEAEQTYAALARELRQIIDDSLSSLTGAGSEALVVNSGPVRQDGIPGHAVSVSPPPQQQPKLSTSGEGSFRLDNGLVWIEIDSAGEIAGLSTGGSTSVFDRDFTGNRLYLYQDVPNMWDAWDIDEHYRRALHTGPRDITVSAASYLGLPSVLIRFAIGNSSVTQHYFIRPDARDVDMAIDIDWNERNKLLRLEFEVALRADTSRSEIQFGHVKRPICTNTSWDTARYEVCAHHWVHVDEGGQGFAIANDSIYGHNFLAIDRNGRQGTSVGLSLLRSPAYPDPRAGVGHYHMAFALVPDAGIHAAIASGYRLNSVRTELVGAAPVAPLIESLNDSVIIETVKLAEDRSGDLIVRLYESHGTRTTTTLVPGFAFDEVTPVDLLERPIGRALTTQDGGRIGLDVSPFEIVSLRWRSPKRPPDLR